MKGKTVIITGAASGIGKATAELFAKEGANVVVSDVNEIAAKVVAEDIVSNGGKAVFIKTDVSKPEEMEKLVESAYAEVDRADLRVIHCDLWHDNIKLHQGSLCPLDFEDTVWGFRAHDIAMAMLDLLETVGEEQYHDLFKAFRRGYEVKMDWPGDPIGPFQVGRLLWKINWVARFESV